MLILNVVLNTDAVDKSKIADPTHVELFSWNFLSELNCFDTGLRSKHRMDLGH